MKDEPEKIEFLAPHVQLLEFESFRRVWQTCCNPQECQEIISAGRDAGSRPAYCPLAKEGSKKIKKASRSRATRD
jgi:hypothetical protein